VTVKEGKYFQNYLSNFVFRAALESYATHPVKGTLDTDMLVEEDLPSAERYCY